MTLKAKWIDGHREPQCSPDPTFPDGIDVIALSGLGPACQTDLPYPAKRCGHFVVTCTMTDSLAATTRAMSLADVSSIPDTELLWRAVRAARARHGARKHPRWIAVMEVFALGSTFASQLCRRFGFDPDEVVTR